MGEPNVGEGWDHGSWEIEIREAAGVRALLGRRYRIVGFAPGADASALRLEVEVETGEEAGPAGTVVIRFDERTTRRLQVGLAKLLTDLDLGRQLARGRAQGAGAPRA